MINIIGGIKKRSTIKVPKKLVRPTSSHKRESIFSIINSYEQKTNSTTYNNKYVLDLFSGSGALGLEAISRGAKFTYFYENNLKVTNQLRENCIKICEKNNFQIIQEDILKSDFSNIKNKLSLVFIDPPYIMNPFKAILNNLNESKKLSRKAMIVIECQKKLTINMPYCYDLVDERNYGRTKIYFIVFKSK